MSFNSLADEGSKRMFDRIDANGDGVVSFDEFTPPGMERPKKADSNSDGEISREEMLEHAQRRGEEIQDRASRRFAKMDLDGNGVVTTIEAREALFYRMDKDQDGYLSPEELKRPKHKRGHQSRKGPKQGEG